ncbi:MAG: SDR family NAD(P)-dependent oxidoreductase [Acidimicrobiia bacterium]
MSSLFDLTGQVAVVTGSSQGIGRAIAERMAEHGARVVFSSRTLADCQACADAVNARHGEERAIAIACDVTDRSAIEALVAGTVDKWGRLDCAVGNALAPGSSTAWIEKIDLDEFDASLSGNVTNNVLLAKLAVPHMKRQGGGNIMFVSSSSGIAALEDFPAYGTVKAALNHLTKILAIQLGPLNIRVNSIAPGIVDTSGPSKERRFATKDTPLGRPAVPDEIAACAVWLASAGGAYATGSVVVVDGGQSLKGMTGPHDLRVFMRNGGVVPD